MTDEKPRTLPIDAHLVMFDTTSKWNFRDEDKPYIDQIHSVYLFDQNEITHCCELTPSYYLIHLYDEVILSEAGGELSEEKKSELYEFYESPVVDNCNIYVHCYMIDEIVKENKRSRHYHYGETGISFEDVSVEDQMESLRERYNCNHML